MLVIFILGNHEEVENITLRNDDKKFIGIFPDHHIRKCYVLWFKIKL